MDRKMLAIGGTIIIIGGIAYWYLSQQNSNGQKCSDYTNQGECEAHDCYWCDGICQSEECNGGELCGALGNCYSGISGIQSCNYLDNLCKCDGSTWNLVEKNSTICKNGISHGTCAINEHDIVFCAENFGDGIDECDIGYSEGCPCDGNCPSYCICEPTIKTCVKKAMPPVSIDGNSSNWDFCEDVGHAGERCELTLDKEWAGNVIEGQLSWSGAFGWAYDLRIKIYGSIHGNWTLLGETKIDHNPPDGTADIQILFAMQGIDTLAFEVHSVAPFRARVESFYGKLSA